MLARRPFLAIGLGLALAAPLAPAEGATPKNTVVMAKAIDDIIKLDPAEVYEFTSGEIVTNCYDRVMRYEPEDLTKLVGGVVASWTVSDDGKTFIFKVRPGQKFHSGNPLTADDIAFSLQRVVILNKTPAFLITQLGWTADNVKQLIKPVDANTLSLTITEPYAPSLVLTLLSSEVASVVDKKLLLSHEVSGDLGHDWIKTHDAGSGAFVMQSWKPNESVVMVANPHYRLGAPKLKRIIMRHTPEAAAQRLALQKGDVDIARDLTADQIKGLAGDPNIVVSQHPSADTWYAAVNLKDERLKNPKVREALRYLVDYDGMVDTFLKGQFIVHQSFWPSGFFASLDDNPYKLDLAKAKQLLTDAGYPNGFELRLDTFNTSPMIDIAQSIQRTFAEAGIKLNIVQNDKKQVYTLYRARQHQMVLLYWSPDYMDPHSNASSFAYNTDNSDNPKSKPLAWRNAWDIPDISKETDAAYQEKDLEKRKQLYLDIQKKVQAEGPFLFLFQPTQQIAARKNIKNFVVGPTFDLVYYRLMSK
jgi:peptide/nickel transport system substrate-binding protein